MTEPHPPHAMPHRFLAVALAAALAGCGAPTPPEGHVAQTREEAVVRSGDVRIRASVVPTATLNEAMAREYGIERSPRSVLLLVGARRGPDMQETSLPARITAHATDLRGVRRPVAMRQVHSGDLVDYIGSVRVTPPDTLRFDLDIELADGSRSAMQFSRDIYPQ